MRRGRGHWSRRNSVPKLSGRDTRHRRTWTFERLEDRHLFSLTPLSSGVSFNGELTPDQVAMGELWWAFKQEGNLSRYTPEQLDSATHWAVWTVDPSSGNSGGSSFNPYLGGSNISIVNMSRMSAESVIEELGTSPFVAAFYPVLDYSAPATSSSFLDEPLFLNQWHLRSTGQSVGSDDFTQEIFAEPGQDLNVVGAWNQGVSGAGVVVAVADNGIQFGHPDLFDNLRNDLSANFTIIPADVNVGTQIAAHATAIAGLIAADGDNNLGAVGVAPNAQLVDLRVGTGETAALDYLTSDANIANLISYRNDAIHIYNHSWSEGLPGRQTAPLGPMTLDALRRSILFGRPGPDGTPLGNIHVFAAGNDAGHDLPPGFPGPGNWDSATYDGLVSSRYTIGVGGVDHDGRVQNSDGTFTNYAETGAGVLVVAPVGSTGLTIGLDTGIGSGLVTTDTFTGAGMDSGFNTLGTLDGDFLDDLRFTTRFSGTSAAAAQVSGVIALMLEANPLLTYRDVQEILVRAARQNDPLHEGWEVNYIEVFQDPAVNAMGVPLVDPFRGTAPVTFVAPPTNDYAIYNAPRFDNGAGYTVSQSRGIFSEETGFAHGVVDAELAVLLAKQWHTKGQNLPLVEGTYTTFARQLGGTAGRIQAAASVGPSNSPFRTRVPGTLSDGPQRTFAAFYQEFFNDMPFTAMMLPGNDRGSSGTGGAPLALLEGFTPPLMKVEWVELKVEIFGNETDMNELRLAIRSPDGTISDLNMFLVTSVNGNANNIDQPLRLGDGGGTSPADGGAPFVYTFSSNRHWGERSDAFYEIDPATGMPLQDPSGRFHVDPVLSAQLGQPVLTSNLVREWELIVENYADSGFTLDTFEFIFHGQELGVGSERISGKVGVDLGVNGLGVADGNFDFDRLPIVDPNTSIPLGIEPFASNITLRARDQSGTIVSQFVTGNDGNYYFDLAPGTYTIEMLDPKGRTAMQDGGLDPRYQTTWTVTVDPTDDFIRTAGREVPLDDDGNGIQDFDDSNGNGLQDANEPSLFVHRAYSDVNFLLDAGTQPAAEVTVSGFVFSDANANGIYDGGASADAPAVGFRAFADLNHSGQFEQGEPNAFTSGDEGLEGTYSFVVTGVTSAQDISIVVEPITVGWTPTNPVAGRTTIFKGPGESAPNTNFGFLPPPDSDPNDPPGDPGDPGTITGVVYSDRNANGIRNASEAGVQGVRVFVDENLNALFDFTDNNTNGVFDDGDEALEPTAVTNQFGGYFLSEVEPGLKQVRIIVPPDYLLTDPAIGFREVTLADGGQLSNVQFGIQNLATRDFGDLPDTYSTRLVNPSGLAGPSHEIVAGFILGTRIDGETNGQPTALADGDDLVGGDEDGILRNGDGTLMIGAVGALNGALVPGTTNQVRILVSGVGGYLNAWMDFNRNGAFDAGEQAIVDEDLNPGPRFVSFDVPANLQPGPIAARFRWGTAGLSFFGPALIGEVEDYLLPTAVVALAIAPPGIPGDYDGNGRVEQNDYNVWVNAFSTGNLAADGNGDGSIDGADYTVWRDRMGQSGPNVAAAGSGSSALASESPSNPAYTMTAAEFQAWQRSQNMPSAALLALMADIGATSYTYDTATGPVTIFGYGAAGQSSSTAADGGAASLAPTVASPGAVAAPVASATQESGGSLSVAPALSRVALPFTATISSQSTVSSLRHSLTADTTSDADLVILDEVLSTIAPTREDDPDVDSLVFESSSEDEAAQDLALATVFDEEIDWRFGG
jgi:subtilisin family serine protease